MPLIQWTPEFSVGVESIDTDHKVLISLLNLLDDAITRGEPRTTVQQVLDALYDYTVYHFGREEALMRASGYPDYDAHVRTHSTLRAQVADIRERYARNPDAIHAREVLSFLKNWLSAHIVGRDQLYAPFMASRRNEVDAADRSFGATADSPPAAAAAG
jgi:hemerythrin-like metal-binding protein